MSISLTQEQKKKRKIISKSLKNEIKQKAHTQTINGVQFIYGLLQKKSQSSLFNNERFLIIKGHQTFGYASKLPEQTLLPFLEVKNIPKCKVQVALDKIEVTNLQQVLIVEFQEDGKKEKTRWEFTCASKIKAFEWRKKLEGARQQKNQNLKNNAVKVIIEDPNESLEQSENELEKKKKIIIENPIVSETYHNGVSQHQANDKQEGEEESKQRVKSKILVREEQLNQDKKNQINHHTNTNPKNQPKNLPDTQQLPEVNIFQSLIYSSPTRQPQQTTKTNLELSKQKSLISSPNTVAKQQQQTRSFEEMSPSNHKTKEEFVKRKKQELQMKEQLKLQNSGPSFLGSVIRTIADNKYQIQKLKKNWGYQFAKATNQFQIIQKFKIYGQLIAVKIVDELALEPRKRYYKPVLETPSSLKYEIDGVSFEFFFHQLKQVTSFEKKGSIISHTRSKIAFQQLKNYDYILQLTNNKGRIRVPIAMTIEYKGFVCLVKAIIPEGESYSNLESLQKELDLLQAESRINNSIFQDGQNGRIVPLMNKVYDKLARAQNNSADSNSKKFDICYIQALKHYLPQDFYRYHSQSTKNPQSIKSAHALRRQLIQHEDYDDIVFNGENMSTVIQRLKTPQHFKEAIDTLIEVSQSISERVNALVVSLQNLDEFITNSKDLSKLMHGYGLNIRYLGLVLERSHQAWLKDIIISQISARCAKAFFQFDLQDSIINLNETKTENVRKFQIKQVVTFLNKVLGNSQESDLFWNQLSRQSQQNFQCYVNKQQLNVGYFIQALQYQCRIQLVNVLDRKQDFFRVAEPLNFENFSAFGINSKTYDLSFTELYTTVGRHLKDLSQQSFEQLSILLNLPRKGSLPSHFRLNNFDQKVILYMINWLSPSQGHDIYYPQEIRLGQLMPTKALYQIKLTEMKWLLKEKKEIEAEKVRDWIIEHVNKWLGQYHPVLSELYDLLSRYYSTVKTEEKKATTYCKSSIKNIEKLLGNTNIKLADNYYMLSEIYINYQKKTQALSSLKRAKEILYERDATQTQAYGIIELRIAQLLLASGLIKEALLQAINSYTRLISTNDLQKLLQAIQLIGRCYEVNDMWTQYAKFNHQLINKTNLMQSFANDPFLLQRILKFFMLPYLMDILKNGQTSKKFLTVVSLLWSVNSITNSANSAQNSSYNYIKQLMLQRNNVFPQEFVGILESDLQELLQEVESSGIMIRWKGFQKLIQNKSLVQKINSISTLNAKAYEFLLILEALTVLLGEGWMEGVMKNR